MDITDLEWESHNVEKLALHGISREDVLEIVALDAWLPSASTDYPDQVRIIGPTYAGRMVTVALDMTDEPGVWRPITGWESSAAELAYYKGEDQ